MEPSNFDCHYLNDEYLCSSEIGQSAEEVHMGGWLGGGSSGGSDRSESYKSRYRWGSECPMAGKSDTEDGLEMYTLVEMSGL